MGVVFSGPVLSCGSSSAVSSLNRSVGPVVAYPGLLSGDSFLCLMAWMQSGSSLADSCSGEKNWGVVMVSASFCCTFLVKDLKAVLASGAWSCWILLRLGLKSCKTMKRAGSAVLVCNSYSGWWAQLSWGRDFGFYLRKHLNSRSLIRTESLANGPGPPLFCFVQEQMSQMQR